MKTKQRLNRVKQRQRLRSYFRRPRPRTKGDGSKLDFAAWLRMADSGGGRRPGD